MKRVANLAACLLTSALVGQPVVCAQSSLDWLDKGGTVRESGSMPIEGLTARPIVLRIHPERAAAVYDNMQLERRLGIFPASREVSLIAISDKGLYKVRGEAQHAGVSGWLREQDVVSPDKNFAASLRSLYERQVIVMDLIKNKQVALGMTPEEVIQSLGKPNQTSSKLTQAGKVESFQYVTYDRVPQYVTRRDQYGNLYNSVTYVSVETGKLSIGFENGAVASIEETEGNPLGVGGVRTVPQPIIGFW